LLTMKADRHYKYGAYDRYCMLLTKKMRV